MVLIGYIDYFIIIRFKVGLDVNHIIVYCKKDIVPYFLVTCGPEV